MKLITTVSTVCLDSTARLSVYTICSYFAQPVFAKPNEVRERDTSDDAAKRIVTVRIRDVFYTVPARDLQRDTRKEQRA